MIDNQKLNELVDETRAYFEAKFKLSKLQLIETTSNHFSNMMAAFIIGGIALIFMIILSFFAGIALSDLLGNRTLGFGIVAGFYFLLFLCLLIFRKKLLKTPIQNAAIKSFFTNEEQE